MKTSTLMTALLFLSACDQAAETDTADTAAANALRVTAPWNQGEALVLHSQAEGLSVLTVSTDSGADGTVDRIQRTYFDDAGTRVRLEEDRDGDGLFEFVQAFANGFDRNGRLVRIEVDEGADGTIDSIEERVLDGRGRPLQILRDKDADGQVDQADQSEWDADGRRVAMWIGPTGANPAESNQTWTYDEFGRNIERRLSRIDPAGNTHLTLYRNHYNSDGQLLDVEVDLHGDGRANNRISRIYESGGRLIETQTDAGADGSIDNATLHIWDAEGRLAGMAIDIGADGVADTLITREYEGFAPQMRGCR